MLTPHAVHDPVSDPMPATPRDDRALADRFVAAPGCIVTLARELAAHRLASPSPAHATAAVAVQREIGRLAGVAPAHLLAELDLALTAADAAGALQALADLGALALLLPEVHALIGFHRSSPLAHKDLWAHTLAVLERCAPEPDLRWIALCHDLGKVATRAVDAAGRLGFHRHEAVGARLFVGIAARLAMPPARAARIAFVIEHHARTNQFEPSWSDRALRRLVRDSGEHLPLMLAFSAADWTTKKAARAEHIRKNLEALRARLGALGNTLAPVLPPGIPEALLTLTAREPGPWVGDALRWLTRERAAGRIDGEDAVTIARHWVLYDAARVVGRQDPG